MCFEKITVHLPVSRGTFDIAAYDNGVDSNFLKNIFEHIYVMYFMNFLSGYGRI